MPSVTINVYNAMSQVVDILPSDVAFAIDDLLAFGIEGAKFTRLFIENKWDGRKHLYSKKKRLFPTGFLGDVTNKLREFGYDVNLNYKQTIVPDSEPLRLSLKPWPHQEKIIKQCISNYRGLIQSSTGSGKTYMEAAICGLINVPTVILTYRQELMYQLQEKFQEYLNVPIGIFGNGEWKKEKFNVCMVQSLIKLLDAKYSKWITKEYGSQDTKSEKVINTHKKELYDTLIKGSNMVILDECIAGRYKVLTPKGDITLEKLYKIYKKKPVYVLSYNAETQRTEYKKVTHMWSKRSNDLYTITFEKGNKIVCTGSHKFLTREGWKYAKNITKNDLILAYSKKYNAYERKFYSPDQMSALVALRLACKYDRTFNAHSLNYKICKFIADLIRQPILGSMHKSKRCHIIRIPKELIRNKTLNGIIDDLNIKSFTLWILFSGIINTEKQNITLPVEHIPSKLLNKLRKQIERITGIIPDHYSSFLGPRLLWEGDKYEKIIKRIQYYIPVNTEIQIKNAKRYKWTQSDPNLYWRLINSVQKLSRTESVYDMEVEKNHNFFVKNYSHPAVLAHNCHHLGAISSYVLLKNLSNAYWRYGFSATAYGFRDDKRDFYIKAAIGDLIARVTTTDLVKAGHLVPTDIIEVPYSHRGKRYPRDSYTEYYTKAVVENEERNKKIVEIAYDLYNRGENILIAVQSINHGKQLTKYLEYLVGPKHVKFLYGEDKNAYRKEVLKIFKEKRLPILISTLISEGVDIPHLSVTIAARGEKSKIATIQLMGRSMRTHPGKTKALYIDIMDYGSRWLTNHSNTRSFIFDSEEVFSRIKLEGNVKKFFDDYYARRLENR